MQKKIFVPIFASVLLCGAAALAQDQPPPQQPAAGQSQQARPFRGRQANPQQMATRMKQMCADRYAHAVGNMSYLETRMSLSAQQKPAFDHWKDMMLAQAKSRADKCAAFTPPAQGAKRPSLTDRLKQRETRLQMRLDNLKAQMPALQALTATLTDDQTRVLDRAVREDAGGRMGQGRRMSMMRRGGQGGPGGNMPMMRRGGPGGPGNGEPPPPPSEQ